MEATSKWACKFLILILSLLSQYQLAAAAGYRQQETQKFFASSEQKTDYFTGFDTDKQRTMRTCVTGPTDTTLSAGKDAVGTFEYIQSVEEIFNREDTSVEVRASVGYLAAKASIDVRNEMTKSAMQKMEYGAIYGYFEKTEGVRWLKGKKFKLTPEAQQLHDKAVKRANMNIFYRECGQGFIVGRQFGSFFKATGTMQFSDNSTEEDKKLTVNAAISYTGALVKASAEAEFEKMSQRKQRNLNKNVHIEFTWSGDPRIASPSSLPELGNAYRNFSKSKNRRDLLSVRVTTYEEAIEDFGKIGEEFGISRARRNKIASVMNGLAVMDQAIITLRLHDHEFAPVARKQLVKQRNLAVEIFRKNSACLKGKLNKGCKSLIEQFENYGKVGKRTANTLVKTMLQRRENCKATEVAVVNGKGHTTCRYCKLGEIPVFFNSNNGKCGYLDEKGVAGSFRFRMKQLSELKETYAEAGVKTMSRNYPDVCAKRGKGCFAKRADSICEMRGFDKSTDFGTMRYSPSYYANGKRCRQSEEDRKPAPETCRIFRFIDCICSKEKRLSGDKCVKKKNT